MCEKTETVEIRKTAVRVYVKCCELSSAFNTLRVHMTNELLVCSIEELLCVAENTRNERLNRFSCINTVPHRIEHQLNTKQNTVKTK